MKTLDIVLFSIFTVSLVAQILILLWCGRILKTNLWETFRNGILLAYSNRYMELLMWAMVPASIALIWLFDYLSMPWMLKFMVVTTPIQIVLTIWCSVIHRNNKKHGAA